MNWAPDKGASCSDGGIIMLFSKSTKFFGAIAMSVMLTNAPAVVFADSAMISTSDALAEQARGQNFNKVHDFLNRADVKKLMIERGLSPEEASSRIASLSEFELKELSGQVEQAKAGGDILVAVLVVVLILFFIRRI